MAQSGLRCRICSRPIQAQDRDLVIGDEGVAHKTCITERKRLCPACEEEIRPQDAIAKVGPQILHLACWAKEDPPSIAGGSAPSPWTLVFDVRMTSAAFSQSAYEELIAASREAIAMSQDTRAAARRTRSTSGRLRLQASALLGG